MLDKSYDGIIFDLDGTMWDTRKPICEAWNIILSRHEEIHRAPIGEADLNDCMGLPMYDIAAKLFPQEQEQVRNAEETITGSCAFGVPCGDTANERKCTDRVDCGEGQCSRRDSFRK